MFSRSTTTVRALQAGALAVSVLLLGIGPALHGGAAAATGPFTGFAGSWSGDGTIKLSSGDSERIRCRVSYVVEGSGNKLRQDLRCASDSYKLDVKSEISYNADAASVSGTWSEKNYGVAGFLSGSAKGGAIRARVDGQNFTATVEMTTKGNQQSVTIRPQQKDVSEVAVTLRKAS